MEEERPMDSTSLKYFQQVALYRNFSRAAERLFISQSALSRQVANLEAELDVKLFKRNTRSVALTEAGAVLYEQCPLLLTHFDTVLRRVAAIRDGRAGCLTIATVGEFGARLIELVEDFSAHHPQVEVAVDDLPFGELTDAIINGVYDLALTLDFMVPASDQIDAIQVGWDRLVAVGRPDLEPPLGPAVDVDQLLKRTIVVPALGVPPLVRKLRLAVGELGAGRTVFREAPNSRSALLAVTLGDAVTVMPLTTVEGSVAAGELVASRIEGLDDSCGWMLVAPKDRKDGIVKDFVALARRRGRPRAKR
jgi:DNA-binding transcriptional LysR family regulator